MTETLSKLAASKDVSAFHALQAPINKEVGFAVHEPMDDESMARRMMAHYAERGIDPSLAIAPDIDVLEEFGGTDALFGRSE